MVKEGRDLKRKAFSFTSRIPHYRRKRETSHLLLPLHILLPYHTRQISSLSFTLIHHQLWFPLQNSNPWISTGARSSPITSILCYLCFIYTYVFFLDLMRFAFWNFQNCGFVLRILDCSESSILFLLIIQKGSDIRGAPCCLGKSREI